MSWMDHRRAAFSLKGPFLSKRTGAAGDITLEFGKTYSYDDLQAANIHDRVIARMYDGYWIDMAPDPLDHDGDGKKGGSLSKVEKAALERAGYTVAAFHKLGSTEGAKVLAEAIADHGAEAAAAAQEAAEAAKRAARASEGAEALETPEKGLVGDVKPGAAATAAEGEAGAATVQGDAVTAPADTKVAAYKCAGFGKYWPLNAAGEKLGKKHLSKTQAEGLANSEQVPLLGQSDPFPAE